MKKVRLGATDLMVTKTSFGALPIQRISHEDAGNLLRMAYDAGVNFFDTANAYTDSEKKIGEALGDVRRDIILATKTAPGPIDTMKAHLEQSLRDLRTDYIDIYQLHCAPQLYRPGDADGIYDWMLEMKRQGVIHHIGITAHKITVAEEALESGLYETLQYPFSVLANDREVALVRCAAEKDVGFIAMKAMAGGLIRHPEVTFAYLQQFPEVVPIYGVQRETELRQWLALDANPPAWDERMQELAEEEKKGLGGDFCRSCGYCMPCPQGIEIRNVARLSQLMTRSPYKPYLTREWQAEMAKARTCINCHKCSSRCPYSLDTPRLIREQVAWYDGFCAEHRDEMPKA